MGIGVGTLQFFARRREEGGGEGREEERGGRRKRKVGKDPTWSEDSFQSPFVQRRREMIHPG